MEDGNSSNTLTTPPYTTDRIKINVGGKIFQTTVSTLQSGSPDSHLAVLSKPLNTSYDPVFIDRDPEIFSVLLSFLRSNRRPFHQRQLRHSRACPPFCESAKFFPRGINRRDYFKIFSVFGVKNIVSILQKVPDYKYFKTLTSFLFEAQERINNPICGCSVLITSLQRQIEALQSRVTTLEVRFGGGYSSSNANPSLSLPPIRSSSRSLSSADNTAPEFVPTTVNLPQPGVLPISGDRLGYPCSDSLLRLLMSTENAAPNILPTTMNLLEHRDSPAYPNMSDYQARLEGFSGGSSQVGSVAEVVGSSNPNQTKRSSVESSCRDRAWWSPCREREREREELRREKEEHGEREGAELQSRGKRKGAKIEELVVGEEGDDRDTVEDTTRVVENGELLM
ncbi:hypothetical protein LguiB_004403 [Lonicera macranthoides]